MNNNANNNVTNSVINKIRTLTPAASINRTLTRCLHMMVKSHDGFCEIPRPKWKFLLWNETPLLAQFHWLLLCSPFGFLGSYCHFYFCFLAMNYPFKLWRALGRIVSQWCPSRIFLSEQEKKHICMLWWKFGKKCGEISALTNKKETCMSTWPNHRWPEHQTESEGKK